MSVFPFLAGLFRGLAIIVVAGVALGAAAQGTGPAKTAAAQATPSPAQPAKAEAPKGVPAIVTQVCAGCHGVDGNSVAPINPKLAGQHPEYLQRQLAAFRAKEGGGEPDRANPIMAGFAMMLNPETAREVSLHYAAQKLQPSAAKEKDLAVLGQRIYRAGIAAKGVPACSGCHGPTGAGIPAEYPRVAGQFAEYSAAQLLAFRQGTRRNSPQMSAIAERMSDNEIKAVADYLAGLR